MFRLVVVIHQILDDGGSVVLRGSWDWVGVVTGSGGSTRGEHGIKVRRTVMVLFCLQC
jgi:hypothetical protein